MGIQGLESGRGIFRNNNVPVHVLAAGKTDYADATFVDFFLIDDHAFVEGPSTISRSVLNSLHKQLISDSSNNPLAH